MPIARFQMSDGRIGRFEVPDGTTPEDAQSLIEQHLAGSIPVEKATSKPEKGFFEGMADAGGAAITNRGVGLMQTAQDLGIPVNSAFGITPEKFKKISQNVVANENKSAEGTGVSGAVVGALADPINLAPVGKLGALALPAYGAISGATGGETDDTGIVGRGINAAEDAGLNYVGGKAIEGVSKLATPVVRKAAEYIPDAVTNKVSSAANYVADKLKPTAAGPTIDKIKEDAVAKAKYANTPELSPQDIGESVIKQKGDTAKTVSKFYNTARDLGNDIVIPTEPFANKAQSLLDSLPQDTFGTDKGAKIKEALTRFSQDKTVSAADLIDMEKNINKYWNRNSDGKYDSLFELKDLIKQKLDDVNGDGTDLFKTAYNNAKQSHKDLNVARFGDNKIVDRLIPEHDFENLADFNRRKLTDNPSEIPDDTMQKLTQFIDKATTPEEVNAALKMIPPEQRDAFVKTALAQKMSKTRRGELVTALKNTPWLITSDWRRPVGAAVRVISPSLDDAGALKALKAVKKTGFTDNTFDKYQKEISKLNSGVAAKKASDQQLKDLAGEMQPYSYAKAAPPPPKPLALPAPEGALAGKSGKTITNATPEQRANAYKAEMQPVQYKSVPKTAKVTFGKPVDIEVNPRRDILQQAADEKNSYYQTNKSGIEQSRYFDKEAKTLMLDAQANGFNFDTPKAVTAATKSKWFSKLSDAQKAKIDEQIAFDAKKKAAYNERKIVSDEAKRQKAAIDLAKQHAQDAENRDAVLNSYIRNKSTRK